MGSPVRAFRASRRNPKDDVECLEERA